MIKEFLKYAIPSGIAMFISSLYTVIDGIFVGQGVGDEALAAINIVIPFTVVLFGFASMLAIGGGSLVSKNIGAKKEEVAVNVFRQVVKFLGIATVVISLIGIIFTEQIVTILGGTESLKPMATEYLRFYSMFCIPNLIGIVLSSFVRNDGKPRLAMVSTISGAITNIILDYIFIFTLGLGIKGAAIATGLGQIVTVAILLPHFIKGKGVLTFGKVKIDFKGIREYCRIGFPSFFIQAGYSIIVLLHNLVLVETVGEVGLSVYSINNYITTNIYMAIYGMTLGVQPLISYNYGRKDSKKMIGFFNITCIGIIITVSIFAVIAYVFGESIIGIFTSDESIKLLAYEAIKICSLSYFAVGLNLITVVYYQAIEKPKYSNLSCVLRSCIYLPIVLFIFAKLFGINGIWVATIVSETLTFITIRIVANIKVLSEEVVLA